MNKSVTYYDDSIKNNIIQIINELHPKGEVHLDVGGNCRDIFNSIQKKNNIKYVGLYCEDCSSVPSENGETEMYGYSFDNLGDGYEYIKKILKGRALASILVVDTLENVRNPEKAIQLIYKLSLEFNCPVIISVPNISHKDICFKLFSGDFEYTDSGLLDLSNISFFTEKRLNLLTEKTGFRQICKNDLFLENSDQHFPEDNVILSESTLINRYLSHIKMLSDANYNVTHFIRAYLPYNRADIESDEKNITNEMDRPFLSIIMRTQGTRIEALREALLCLTGQTSEDFEVLLMAHRTTAENLIQIEKVLAGLPDFMSNKVRIIKVNDGNRTKPLNVGFENARGLYISILDDDDLVLDNYVESFKKGYEKFKGRVIHSYCVSQKWAVNNLLDGTAYMTAISSPNNIYCTDFNYISQLATNFCPVFSLAFPAYSFHKLGIMFDESLTTTEDWDFIMRTAFICGVADVSSVTGIYRIWENLRNSYTIHSKDEWEKNHNKIKLKHENMPLLLPEGYSKRILNFSGNVNNGDSAIQINGNISWSVSTLYINTGNGYSEYCSKKAYNNSVNDQFKFTFGEFDDSAPIQELRWDPVENSTIFIQSFVAEIKFKDGSVKTLGMENITHNGEKINNGIFFKHNDAQIILSKIPGKEISLVTFTGKWLPYLQVECTTDNKSRSFIRRCLRFAKRICKKLLGS